MLKITIPAAELWDEANQEFINTKEQSLQLEHSLVSISKWESKWHKAYLDEGEKTLEETVDYVKCMTLTQNVDPKIYNNLTDQNLKQIREYIKDPMSATYFSKEEKRSPRGEKITAEIIYYWMITFNIPFECRKWHLNRLLTLIRVCDIKSQKPKKMSMRELMSRNAALNAARRKKLNTNG